MTNHSRLFVPHGHFYSPLIDPEETTRRSHLIWPQRPHANGIDFNDASHRQLLTDVFPALLRDWDYPDHPRDSHHAPHYYTCNPFFSMLDAPALYIMMRHYRPRRIHEIGSGFSTLLMADVNQRHLDNRCSIQSIDPYPQTGIHEATGSQLLQHAVQDVGAECFDDLSEGDFLFIDSSHVAKTGSDVNFLFFQVLPRLKPGVLIHIHDIFLPLDYPKNWVLKEGRCWNEQYVLHAFLMYNTHFEVIFGCNYAFYRHPDLVRHALNRRDQQAFGGGSLWLRKRC